MSKLIHALPLIALLLVLWPHPTAAQEDDDLYCEEHAANGMLSIELTDDWCVAFFEEAPTRFDLYSEEFSDVFFLDGFYVPDVWADATEFDTVYNDHNNARDMFQGFEERFGVDLGLSLDDLFLLEDLRFRDNLSVIVGDDVRSVYTARYGLEYWAAGAVQLPENNGVVLFIWFDEFRPDPTPVSERYAPMFDILRGIRNDQPNDGDNLANALPLGWRIEQLGAQRFQIFAPGDPEFMVDVFVLDDAPLQILPGMLVLPADETTLINNLHAAISAVESPEFVLEIGQPYVVAQPWREFYEFRIVVRSNTDQNQIESAGVYGVVTTSYGRQLLYSASVINPVSRLMHENFLNIVRPTLRDRPLDN